MARFQSQVGTNIQEAHQNPFPAAWRDCFVKVLYLESEVTDVSLFGRCGLCGRRGYLCRCHTFSREALLILSARRSGTASDSLSKATVHRTAYLTKYTCIIVHHYLFHVEDNMSIVLRSQFTRRMYIRESISFSKGGGRTCVQCAIALHCDQLVYTRNFSAGKTSALMLMLSSGQHW